MKSGCAPYQDKIVDIAEGRRDADAEAHVAECQACTKRLLQLRSLLAALTYPLHSAPDAILSKLPEMVPVARPTVIARLLGYGPALAARSSTDDIQLLVGAEDIEVRVIYARQGDGIRVMSRLPEGGWITEGAQDRVDFMAPTEEATGFTILREDARIYVPSLTELRDHGSDGSR